MNPGDYEPREAPQPPPMIPPNQPISPYAPATVPMPAQYPYQPQQVVVVQQPQTPSSGLAILSLIFGIVGFVSSCCSFGIPSAAAVILGHVAMNETKSGKKSGHGMAVAGLVLGYIVVIPAIVLSIMVVFGGLLGSIDPTPTPTP